MLDCPSCRVQTEYTLYRIVDLNSLPHQRQDRCQHSNNSHHKCSACDIIWQQVYTQWCIHLVVSAQHLADNLTKQHISHQWLPWLISHIAQTCSLFVPGIIQDDWSALSDLAMTGLVYRASPDVCCHNFTLLPIPSPCPVRGHWTTL